ncbi:arsenic resistance protein ArsB [Secundilactobacillus pentosiphilus]|uniref:Arsenic resistance protein ArsB n=1 Tax=Secundilactobacillus pentosiphilus TaxID=1714682 RepID=A0A1Z5ITG5_9LACO|nr:arsenic resistance protein ArsB [Secundilactobacillus pentosiphilus]
MKNSAKLSKYDRYMTVWIIIAMVAGIGLGVLFPQVSRTITQLQVGTTSVPIAIGLILMLYPVLTKVKYAELGHVFSDWRTLSVSLFQNWLFGPLLMFLLAVTFLRHEPGYMTGLILIGLARCIAMVIIWSQLAHGDNEYTAGLVALNSIFQIVCYTGLAYVFLTILPGWFGLSAYHVAVSMGAIAKSIGLYLGVPFIAGISSRYLLIHWRGREWFEAVYLKRINRITFWALIFTILVMFAIKSKQVVALPLDMVRIAIPLILYFVLMFSITFIISYRMKRSYAVTTSLSLTAASNNFELAIAVAVGVFGINSPEAFTAVIGPLVEVPVMLGLVNVALHLRHTLNWEQNDGTVEQARSKS